MSIFSHPPLLRTLFLPLKSSLLTPGLSRCSDVSATSVGKIKSIMVTGRDDSGLVKEVTITGDKGSVVVSGQSNILIHLCHKQSDFMVYEHYALL